MDGAARTGQPPVIGGGGGRTGGGLRQPVPLSGKGSLPHHGGAVHLCPPGVSPPGHRPGADGGDSRRCLQDPITHTVVSVITGENAASIRLHEQMGFRYSGTLHAVGQKFGRWLDIVNYEWSAK